jgi:hypothetical protein
VPLLASKLRNTHAADIDPTHLPLLHILCRQELLQHQLQMLLSSRTKLLPIHQDERVQVAVGGTLHRQSTNIKAA